MDPSFSFPHPPLPRLPLFFGTAVRPMIEGADCFEALDQAMEAGVHAIDTARGYGQAEAVLGRWMKARANRKEILLLSKCGDVQAGRVHLDRRVIEGELAQSLDALQTDYIDLYLLHRDDPKTPIGESLETLHEAQQKGLIRYYGVSNWRHERIIEANAYAHAHGMAGFALSSPNFGLALQVEDPWGGDCVTLTGPQNQKARAFYRKSGMPVLSYSSLARGFFSGHFQSGDWTGARKVLDGPAQKAYLCAENMDRLQRAEILAQKKGQPVARLALSYLFSKVLPLYAVVSMMQKDHLMANIEAATHPLSAEEVAYLEEG